jgi:Fic family protein
MAQYIWQQADWCQSVAPAFTWQEEGLCALVEQCQQLQKRLAIQSESFADIDRSILIDTLVQNALRTSEIEGEILNVASVRSSVVRHLGLERASFVEANDVGTPQTEALVNLLLDATIDYQQPLTKSTLCQWQSALFPEPPRYKNLVIGKLRGKAPMQVVSGRMDRPIVHFEAPPREVLTSELTRFLQWFNAPPENLNPLLRAAIAHLWLITLHPFDDGNGRVTRAVTDRALSQAEHNGVRYYSLSAAIMARRKEYYEQLEAAQKGTLDITQWLIWFLSVLDDAIQQGQHRFQRVINKTRFWQQQAQTPLTERQIKVLNRLLDTEGEAFPHGINASKYKALAKVSKATATRELSDLLNKGCIVKLPGGGRSTRYMVAIKS